MKSIVQILRKTNAIKILGSILKSTYKDVTGWKFSWFYNDPFKDEGFFKFNAGLTYLKQLFRKLKCHKVDWTHFESFHNGMLLSKIPLPRRWLFNPLMPAAGLFKYVSPFCYHQALKG